ncbi:MAG TPA: flagellar hook-associated protein FlgL [Thiotrichales bacterium]|nr:flagellar hook-associated protein FlgL [Thiotrichales bacterium]
MRISTPQINFNGIQGVRKHSEDLYKIQEKLSSGQRVNRPGDDPVAAARIYTIDKSIKQLDQFNANGMFAQGKLELEDTTLTNFTDVMQRIRELTIYGMNDTQSTNGRQAIAAEMRGLLENLKALANTQDSNGEYIFSGDKSTTPAYQAVTAANLESLGTGIPSVSGPVTTGVVNPPLQTTAEPTAYFTKIAAAGTPVEVRAIDGSTVNSVTTSANQIVDNFNGKLYTLNPTTQAYEDAQGEPLYAYTGSHTGARFVQVSPDNDHIDNGNDMGDASRVRVSDMGARVFGYYDKTSSTPWKPSYDVNKNPQLNYNIFDTMREMINQLESGQSGAGAVVGNTKLDDYLAEIDTSLEAIRNTQADVGTRLQRIDMQNQMNQDFKVGLSETLSKLRDQDLVSGIDSYQKILTSLQLSQQTFAKLSEMSLFNYIR